jgi:hypothetical protein
MERIEEMEHRLNGLDTDLKDFKISETRFTESHL